MNIRFANSDDISKMHEILSYYIKHTAVLFTDVIPNFNGFKENILNIMKEYPVLVAEENGKVIAFTYAKRIYDGKAYNFTIESTIYIEKEHTGKGIGTKLYTKLEYILTLQNAVSINAYIAISNENNHYLDNKSKRFHEKLGFIETAYFKNWGYKFNKWYDSVWMSKQINTPTIPPKEFIPLYKLDIKSL